MTLGWKRFVKSLEATIVFIFWEFYANVLNAINNKITISRVQFLFSPSDINVYYGLMYVGQGEYETYLDNMYYA